MIRVTIRAGNVTDTFGVLYPIGSIQTVGNEYGRDLIQQQRAYDTDGALTGSGNSPFVGGPLYGDPGLPAVELRADDVSAARGARVRALIQRLRLQPAPGIMASPPTITAQAGAFGTHTTQWPAAGYEADLANWAPFIQIYGGTPARTGNAVRPRTVTSNPATAVDPNNVTGFNPGTTRFGFYCDDASVVIPGYVAGASGLNTWGFRFLVRNDSTGLMEYVSRDATLAAAGPGISYFKLDFGAAARRLIVVECPIQGGIYPIFTTSTGSVWSPRDTTPSILVLGDSYVEGPLTAHYTSPQPYRMDNWARIMGDMLGCPDVWCSGASSTGFDVGNGNTPSYVGRAYDALNLMPDGVTKRSAYTPDLIVAQNSVNDNGRSDAVMQAKLTEFHAYIRARAPYVPVIYTGCPWNTNGATLSTVQQREAAIKAWILDKQLTDPAVGFFGEAGPAGQERVKGTGAEGATTGDGNADVLVGLDRVHPSYRGQFARAEWYARGVMAALLDMSTKF